MPDIFDQVASQAPVASPPPTGGGDIFDQVAEQLPATAAAPSVVNGHDLTTNTAGEGTYQMLGSKGETLQVPYSRVETAKMLGYTLPGQGDKLRGDAFGTGELARYAHDSAYDPNIGHQLRRAGEVMEQVPLVRGAVKSALQVPNTVLGFLENISNRAKAASDERNNPQGPHWEQSHAAEQLQGLEEKAMPGSTNAPQGTGEDLGAIAETLAEWAYGEGEVKSGLKAASTATTAEKLQKVGQMAKWLESHPKVAMLVKSGLLGAGQGAQALAHGASPEEAAAGAAIGGGMGLAGEAGSTAAARLIEGRQMVPVEIGGETFHVPARGPKPTPNQAAGQRVLESARNNVLERNMQEVNEGRSVPANAPGLPARTGPYTFEIKGTPQFTRTEGTAAQDAEVQSFRHTPVKQLPAISRVDAETAGAPTREGGIFPNRPELSNPTRIPSPPRDPRLPEKYSYQRVPFFANDYIGSGAGGEAAALPGTSRGLVSISNSDQAAEAAKGYRNFIGSAEFQKLDSAEQTKVQDTLRSLDAFAQQGESGPVSKISVEQYAEPRGQAASDVLGGQGTLRTQNPDIARMHLEQLTDVMDSPDFAQMPPAQQDAIRAARTDTQRQLGEYHQEVLNNVPWKDAAHFDQIDIPKVAQQVGSWGEVGEQVERSAKDIYQRLDELSGNRFNALRNAEKDAWKSYLSASGLEEQRAAAQELGRAHANTQQMFQDIAHAVSPKELAAANEAYRSAQVLNAFGRAVDGSFTGNAARSARSWGYRGFSGDMLANRVQRVVQQMGKARVERVVGADNLQTVLDIAEANRSNASRARFGAAVDQVGQWLAQHGGLTIAPRAAAAGAGVLGAHALGMSGYFGAAAGEAAYEGSRVMLQKILTNPKAAQNLLYAVRAGAKPEVYVPMVGAILQQADRQNQPKEGQQ